VGRVGVLQPEITSGHYPHKGAVLSESERKIIDANSRSLSQFRAGFTYLVLSDRLKRALNAAAKSLAIEYAKCGICRKTCPRQVSV
jgi:hypothetical protein